MKNICFVFLLFFVQTLSGQSSVVREDTGSLRQGHEFSLSVGGGLSTLRYQLPLGGVSGGFGGDFGVGYTCFVFERTGIHAGVGLGLYGAKATPDGAAIITPGLVDSDGDVFDMHTVLTGYSETQNAMFLNIPLMIKYQTRHEKEYYVMGGVKAGVPLGGNYSSSNATFFNSGYYPKYGNWATNQEFAGFGTFDDRSFDGDLAFEVSLALAVEAGMKYRIGNSLSLYIGAFFDFGLNNAAKTGSFPFIAYSADNGSGFAANSVVASLADKVNVMAFGLKVRVGLKKQ